MNESKDEIREYIKRKKEESKKIKEETHKIIPKENPITEKPDKEFDDFINHIQLESNTTTTKKILQGIEDIKKILMNEDKTYKEKITSNDKEALIYMNDPSFPFGDTMIGKGDVMEYLRNYNEITIRNTCSKIDDIYDEDEEYGMSD
jgi:hypothetical protein